MGKASDMNNEALQIHYLKSDTFGDDEKVELEEDEDDSSDSDSDSYDSSNLFRKQIKNKKQLKKVLISNYFDNLGDGKNVDGKIKFKYDNTFVFRNCD